MNLAIKPKLKRYVFLYIATSVIMFISLFTLSSKLIAVSLLIWIIALLCIIYSIMKPSEARIVEIAEHVKDKAANADTKKERIRYTSYMALLPLCAVAILVAVMLLTVKFFE